MSNTNTKFGARYFNAPWGGTAKFMGTPYTVAAGESNDIFVGDFVKLTGDSDIGQEGIYYPSISKTGEGDLLVGFVLGFEPHSDYLAQIYRTASTVRTVYVCDDPYAMLVIQSTDTFAKGDIGNNFDVDVSTGGSVVTGLSGMQLKHSTLSPTSGQLRAIRLSPTTGSEFGAYTKVICLINEHFYKGIAGV